MLLLQMSQLSNNRLLFFCTRRSRKFWGKCFGSPLRFCSFYFQVGFCAKVQSRVLYSLKLGTVRQVENNLACDGNAGSLEKGETFGENWKHLAAEIVHLWVPRQCTVTSKSPDKPILAQPNRHPGRFVEAKDSGKFSDLEPKSIVIRVIRVFKNSKKVPNATSQVSSTKMLVSTTSACPSSCKIFLGASAGVSSCWNPNSLCHPIYVQR